MRTAEERCAACVVNIMGGHGEVVMQQPDGNPAKRRAMSFDDAVAAVVAGHRVQHPGTLQRFSLWAITVVGGTPTCPDHAAGTWRAWTGEK